MARIDYSDPAKHNDRTRELLGKNRNANIFRMMAHSPSHLEQYCRLGGAIRHKGELDPVVRELAITRTGILCEAPYEIVAQSCARLSEFLLGTPRDEYSPYLRVPTRRTSTVSGSNTIAAAI